MDRYRQWRRHQRQKLASRYCQQRLGLPISTNPHFPFLLLLGLRCNVDPCFSKLVYSNQVPFIGRLPHLSIRYSLKSRSIPRGAMHKPANRAQPFKKGTIMSHRGSAVLRTVSEIISSDENRETAALRVISLTREPLKILTFEGSLPTPRSWKRSLFISQHQLLTFFDHFILASCLSLLLSSLTRKIKRVQVLLTIFDTFS